MHIWELLSVRVVARFNQLFVICCCGWLERNQGPKFWTQKLQASLESILSLWGFMQIFPFCNILQLQNHHTNKLLLPPKQMSHLACWVKNSPSKTPPKHRYFSRGKKFRDPGDSGAGCRFQLIQARCRNENETFFIDDVKGYVEGKNQTPLVAMLFFCSYYLTKKKGGNIQCEVWSAFKWCWIIKWNIDLTLKVVFSGLNSGGGAFHCFVGVDGRRIFGWRARCTTI